MDSLPGLRLLRSYDSRWLRGDVRETLHRAGFEEHCSPVAAHQSVATVIDEWRERNARSIPPRC